MYQKILVPVDGSPTSDRGLEEAIRLGVLTHGHLRLIHVVDELSFSLTMGGYAAYAGEWMTKLRDDGQHILGQAKVRVTAAGLEAQTVLYEGFDGRVDDLVVAEAKKWPADLIVIGTHGRRGVGRLVLGSSAERMLRQSPVPVLLVRAPETATVPTPSNGDEKPLRVSLPTGALALE